MISKFNVWLNKPYFLIDKLPVKLSMTIGVGLFTFLFLFIFQPFGIDKVVNVNPALIIGYGTLVSLSLFISYFIIPVIVPFYFNVKNWTIRKEATFLFITFLIITTTNYFYHQLYISKYMPAFSYIKFMSIVFSIGVFPVLFIIFMIERYLQNKLNTTPKNIIEQIRKEKKEFVTIESDNLKEAPLKLDIDSILYAQSNNNYTTIVYKDENKTKKELIRITLKKVEDLLNNYSQFIRCHRSFIVNKNEIIKTEGNARSLQIFLNHINEPIPVSRSFPKDKLTS